ncbi:hypothetical protein HYQ44_012364 [Verticillium longisporum]|nr:hypothetical protein HYQ44_012364 [Verticillium longisporum]
METGFGAGLEAAWSTGTSPWLRVAPEFKNALHTILSRSACQRLCGWRSVKQLGELLPAHDRGVRLVIIQLHVVSARSEINLAGLIILIGVAVNRIISNRRVEAQIFQRLGEGDRRLVRNLSDAPELSSIV